MAKQWRQVATTDIELMGLRCYPLAHQAAPHLSPHTDQQPGSALLATHIHLLPFSFLIFILSTLLCCSDLSSICFKAVKHRKSPFVLYFCTTLLWRNRKHPRATIVCSFPGDTFVFIITHERVERDYSILSLYVNTDTDSPRHLEIRKSCRLKHTIFANYMNILNRSLNRPIL